MANLFDIISFYCIGYEFFYPAFYPTKRVFFVTNYLILEEIFPVIIRSFYYNKFILGIKSM